MSSKLAVFQFGLASAAAAVLLMLENEPADVTSRVSHWYEFWQARLGHLPSTPEWLSAPSADSVAYAVGFGLLALAAAPTVMGWVRSLHSSRSSPAATAQNIAKANPSPKEGPTPAASESDDDRYAKDHLAKFVMQKLIPAMDAQIKLGQ
jgi:hypothetical protein